MKKVDQPMFDVASWKPTRRALELLGETPEAKAAAERLERAERARLMEEKYSGGLTFADRLVQCRGISSRYGRIEALAGKNGECHSRKTTYRRWKFGKGNVSRKGWLRQGFDQTSAR